MASELFCALALLFVSVGATRQPQLNPLDYLHPINANGSRGFIDGARPPGVNPQLDCAIKQYAWEYAKFLIPERGSFSSVYDALQLGAVCGLPPPQRGNSPAEQWTRKSRYFRDTADQTIYVDATKGSDSNSGSQSSPLQTIPAALGVSRSSPGKDTIILRAGTFILTEPLLLTAIDNGLTITNYPGEQATISSGKTLTFSWKPSNSGIRSFPNTNCVYGRVAPAASSAGITYFGTTNSDSDCAQACVKDQYCTGYTWHDQNQGSYALMCYLIEDGSFDMDSQTGHSSGQKLNIYATDLSQQGITQFDQLFIDGKRQIRARHPNANPETNGIYTVSTGYFANAKSWKAPLTPDAAINVKVSDPSFPTSLNPYFPNFQNGIGGPASVFNPEFSFWATSNPPYGTTFAVPSGLTFDPALFPQTNWSNPTTGIVHAYHCGYWGNWQFPVSSYSSSGTLTWTKGGFQEGRGCSTGSTWYIENIQELVDAPTEWFFDNRTNLLYYYPNSTTLPTQGIVPTLRNLITISGTQHVPVQNITLSGLTFTHTLQTFLEEYEVPSGGDWSAHRGGTILIEGTRNTVVENSLFQAVGGNAIVISNYNRNVTIDGNEFIYPGDSCIIILGSSTGIDGTEENYPVGTHILNNVGHEIGIWGKQTGGVYQSLCAETIIEKNVFFNGPRAGINVNDGLGGGKVIQDNLLFNLVRETADHGPINSWDRQPYVTTFNTGKPSIYPKQNQITRNFLIGGYNSAWPIDHDDGSAYYLDSFNFVCYGGSKNYLGHSKINRNNVYIDPEVSVWGGMRCMNQYSNSLEEEWSSCICSSESSDGNVYNFNTCSQSDLTYVPTLKNNSFWFPTGVNVTISCGSAMSLTQWQALGEDTGSTSNGPASIDQILGWAKTVLNGP